MKKLRIVVLTMFMALFVAAGCATSVHAAAKPKLNKKKVSVYVGKTKTIKLKNANRKVKWSTSNKKIKIVKKSGKYSNTVKIKGKKKGTVKLTAKVNGKKYVCKVTVKKKAANTSTNNTSNNGNYNNTSGGNSNTGTSSTVSSNFAYLKNYILTYGSTNTNGYKFISHTNYENGVKTGISYDSSESKFSFTMTFVNDSSQIGVNMDISEYYTGSADIKCVVYDDVYGFGCITYNALTTSTYYKDKVLYFTIDTILEMTESDAQELSNSGLNLAMTTWEYLLESQPGLSLNELGFTSYNY